MQASPGPQSPRSSQADAATPRCEPAQATSPKRSPLRKPFDVIATWRRRAEERSQLAAMTNSELHDIGVTSSDRWIEVNKPFWRK